ncbi:hypothetical protein DSECCO2_278090 [anaerobic digester metagenome]
MGTIVKAQDITLCGNKGLFRPIIYCNPPDELAATGESINIFLARQLLKQKANRRSILLEKCLGQVLSEFPGEPIIKDFDVMFNPSYQVDILKIMISAYKKKPFSIIWPGTYGDGQLFYAEEGYLDYKVFKIEEYDVTCII